MSIDCKITQRVIDAQARMFRLAKRDYHLTRKVMHLETGIPETTLKSYEEGTQMPLSALVKMIGVVPSELVSIVFAGTGKHLVDDGETTEGTFDDLARAAGHYASEYIDAKADGSVTHIEKARLKDIARTMQAISAKVGS